MAMLAGVRAVQARSLPPQINQAANDQSKNSVTPLKLFFGFFIFSPSSQDGFGRRFYRARMNEAGARIWCPVPARTHLALWRIWLRALDLSPLFRSTIGFDRLFDLVETAQRAGEDHYPPYNIERLADDRYQITLAVAGFSPDEISITAEQNVVTIEASKPDKADRDFIYRGISTRQFKRQFSLADYVQVKGASFDNGLLRIELLREIPEAMKPRRIAINGSPTAEVHQLEAKAA
jgi:molecular chaperone IbpA